MRTVDTRSDEIWQLIQNIDHMTSVIDGQLEMLKRLQEGGGAVEEARVLKEMNENVVFLKMLVKAAKRRV